MRLAQKFLGSVKRSPAIPAVLGKYAFRQCPQTCKQFVKLMICHLPLPACPSIFWNEGAFHHHTSPYVDQEQTRHGPKSAALIGFRHPITRAPPATSAIALFVVRLSQCDEVLSSSMPLHGAHAGAAITPDCTATQVASTDHGAMKPSIPYAPIPSVKTQSRSATRMTDIRLSR